MQSNSNLKSLNWFIWNRKETGEGQMQREGASDCANCILIIDQKLAKVLGWKVIEVFMASMEWSMCQKWNHVVEFYLLWIHLWCKEIQYRTLMRFSEVCWKWNKWKLTFKSKLASSCHKSLSNFVLKFSYSLSTKNTVLTVDKNIN